MDRLSSEDLRILELESATIAGHTVKVLLVDQFPSDAGSAVDVLRRHVSARLGRAPRLRQRLLSTPLGVAPPAWVDDPQFEIERHVRTRAREGRVGVRDLPRLVGELMRERLDRSRPLWSLDVVELADDGGLALLWCIHHCMADGMAAMRLGAAVLWDTGQSVPNGSQDATNWHPQAMPSTVRLLASGLGYRFTQSTHLSPRRMLPPALKASRRSTVEAVARELQPAASPSPLDAAPATSEREIAFTSVALDDLKQIGHKLGHGATVNDVLLALVAGGLHLWIERHGGAPITLRAKIPVNLHHHDELANRDSFFCVDLPLAEPDSVQRLRAIQEETNARKSEHDPQVIEEFFRGLSPVHGPLVRFFERLADNPQVAALSISNVPGPHDRVYIAGARVRQLYSIAEIAPRHALRVAAISLAGRLSLGLCSDPTIVANLDYIVQGIQLELADLTAKLDI